MDVHSFIEEYSKEYISGGTKEKFALLLASEIKSILNKIKIDEQGATVADYERISDLAKVILYLFESDSLFPPDSVLDVSMRIGLWPAQLIRLKLSDEDAPRSWRTSNQEKVASIDDCLGKYDPAEALIVLYVKEILSASEDLKTHPKYLARIVELHEAAHAIVHLGCDADLRTLSVNTLNAFDSGSSVSPLHETLAQLLTWHCIKETKLTRVFDVLNQRQPAEYTMWVDFRDVPLEHVRGFLVALRGELVVPTIEAFRRLTLGV